MVVGPVGYGSLTGRVYVCTKTARGWQQSAELQGPGGSNGGRFGYSVAIAGTTIVVGSIGPGAYAGRAYVFSDTSTGWQQVAELEGSDTVYDDFGLSVAISGTTIVVGAPVDNSETGRVHVFRQTATDWHQTAELNGSDSANGDYFGNSVAISGNTVVGGAPVNDFDTGRAYVFTRTATGWQQTAELKGCREPNAAYFHAAS
ncbi:MAG TPA: FG-GAP repeat protein [Acidimicrobiales bacterium]|nr:FG-GAP repeat protein [Acidimicrobiales bacterium]